MALRVALVAVVLVLVVWRPRRLHVAWPATAGALVAFGCGWVSVADLRRCLAMTWNAMATLVGLMLLSAVLDENGAFDYAARKVALLSRGSGRRLYVLLGVLSAVTAAVLGNDGAILLITPMLIELGRVVALPAGATFALLFATGFLVDALSTPLVPSNLTNVLLADGLHLGSTEFARAMIPPTLVMLPAAMLALWLVLRRDLPSAIDLPRLAEQPKVNFRRRSRVASASVLVLFFVGVLGAERLGIPLGIVCVVLALLLALVESLGKVVKPMPLATGLPWGIVIFSMSLFLVVMALANAGVATWFAHALGRTPVRAGLVVGGAAAIFNNLPVLLLALLALATTPGGHGRLPYAALLGANVGSKLFPMGSLATLLWLEVLAKHRVDVGWGRYVRLAALPTVVTLIAGLITLTLF